MTEAHTDGCVIMDAMTDYAAQIERVTKAGRRYGKADAEMEAARRELADAMLALRDATRDGGEPMSNERIARLTPLSNTQAFRLIRQAEGRASES